MQLAMIGLGRMGANMAQRAMRDGHECVAYDLDHEAVAELERAGARGARTVDELIAALDRPRAVWMMVPAGAVDQTIAAVAPHLDDDDVLIDGGNSYYHDDLRRAAELRERGIHYVDVQRRRLGPRARLLPDDRRRRGRRRAGRSSPRSPRGSARSSERPAARGRRRRPSRAGCTAGRAGQGTS